MRGRWDTQYSLMGGILLSVGSTDWRHDAVLPAERESDARLAAAAPRLLAALHVIATNSSDPAAREAALNAINYTR